MLGIYGSYRLHAFESMLYNLTHPEWMFSDSLGSLARSLGLSYALRLLIDSKTRVPPCFPLFPCTLPSNPQPAQKTPWQEE